MKKFKDLLENKAIYYKITLLLCLFFITSKTFCQELEASENIHSAIIKLNWRYLDLAVIDDMSIFNGKISTFLNEEGEKFLANQGINPFLDLEFRKVFPFLSTKDTVSISRLGTPVRIPAFWSVFAFDLNYDASILNFCQSLERLSPLVLYAHPNYTIKLQSDPNDPEFGNQHSFNSAAFPYAHIDLDSAWNIETGKPFIKVGVYDSGIDSTHPDIKLLGGKGYYVPDYVETEWGIDLTNHGTRVAGVIGAKRNNGFGVAGIAGGDGSDSTGVSLIDFMFASVPNPNVEVLCAGIIDGARSVGSYFDWSNLPVWNPALPIPPLFDASQGFGIHVANHSYMWDIEQLKTEDSVSVDDIFVMMSDCNLCIEAYLFSLENNVTHVVSRGNVLQVAFPGGSDKQWPQRYPDHMVISVGGIGYDGEHWWYDDNFASTDGSFGSMTGGEIDIVAPSTDTLIITTQSQYSLLELPLYGNFNGTSAAAPHVTGAVALLLSYYNKPCYSNYNLANEDIEYILQISTIDADVAGYDDKTGHGRLSVDNLFDSLNRPYYQIVHPEDLPAFYTIFPPDTVGIYGKAFQSYGPYSTSDMVDPAISPTVLYKVERFKIEATYDFSSYTSGASVDLLGAWPRINTSTFSTFIEDTLVVGFPPNDSQYKQMNFEKNVELVSFDENSITLRGYLYHFYIDFDEIIPVDAWYPIDTANFNFDYSIYLRDTVNGLFFDFPCDSVNNLFDSTAFLKENLKSGFLVYPNPFENSFTLQSKNQPISEIYVYDISGRCIFQRNELNTIATSIDANEFANGFYLVEVIFTDNTRLTKKIIKR